MATLTKPRRRTPRPPADTPDDDSAPLEPIILRRIERAVMRVPIEGITPVIPHKWSEKARRMMLDKQQGVAQEKRAPKDPAQEAHDATYWLPDGRIGIPVGAFKGAIADAARYFDKTVTITLLKRIIEIIGDGPDVLVPITGTITMREDMPRNSGGTADLRYRNMISDWSAELVVQYPPSQIQPASLIAIIDAAGIGGVGDWRPSSPKSVTGTYGKFQVAGYSE